MEKIEKEDFKLREDLNDIVTNIKIVSRKFKDSEISECVVELYSGEKIVFTDKNNLLGLFRSYLKTGQKDFIKSKKLIDEFQIDEDGTVKGVYTCVKYELSNGEIYRLFPKQYSSNSIIKNYYSFFKEKNRGVENGKK